MDCVNKVCTNIGASSTLTRRRRRRYDLDDNEPRAGELRATTEDGPIYFESMMLDGIERFPPEVMSVVFKVLPQADRVSCLRVSMRWNEIIVNNPHLWAAFSLTRTSATALGIRTVLERSKALPLRLKLRIHEPESWHEWDLTVAQQLELLKAQMVRVAELELQVDDSVPRSQVYALLETRMPKLESLRFACKSRGLRVHTNYDATEVAVHPGCAKTLQCLEAFVMPILGVKFPQLTYLAVIQPEDRLNLDDLCNAVHSCPLLRQLRIAGTRLCRIRNDRQPLPVALDLLYVNLDSRSGSKELVRLFAPPKSAVIEVRSRFDESEDPALCLSHFVNALVHGAHKSIYQVRISEGTVKISEWSSARARMLQVGGFQDLAEHCFFQALARNLPGMQHVADNLYELHMDRWPIRAPIYTMNEPIELPRLRELITPIPVRVASPHHWVDISCPEIQKMQIKDCTVTLTLVRDVVRMVLAESSEKLQHLELLPSTILEKLGRPEHMRQVKHLVTHFVDRSGGVPQA